MSSNESRDVLAQAFQAAIESESAANAHYAEVERSLGAAGRRRNEATAERKRLERLVRGTGVAIKIQVSYAGPGERNIRTASAAFEKLKRDGVVVRGAELIRVEGGYAIDDEEVGRVADCYYVIP